MLGMEIKNEEFVVKQVPSFWYEICMAGDIAHAKQCVRKFCFDIGLCVTIDPTTYIYTGGEEEGFKVRLIHYPRFPTERADLYGRACQLGIYLAKSLCQTSFSVVGDDTVTWLTRRPFDVKQAKEAEEAKTA